METGDKSGRKPAQIKPNKVKASVSLLELLLTASLVGKEATGEEKRER